MVLQLLQRHQGAYSILFDLLHVQAAAVPAAAPSYSICWPAVLLQLPAHEVSSLDALHTLR